MPAMRIASLVPAATDLVGALGLAGRLVGVSHACDLPAARGLPVLTRSGLPRPGEPHDPSRPGAARWTAAEVDRLVSTSVAAGAALYQVDRARLAALRPDLVLSQSICDVCAARVDACDLPPDARLLELTASDLAGLAVDLRALASAVGEPARARPVLSDMSRRLEALASRTGPKPRVVTLEWGDPPFLGGHWLPELVERAGGTHLLSRPGAPSRRASWAEIAASDPDLVIFAPCGYTRDEAVAEARALRVRPELAGLRAVREGRLWAVHASPLFSRCTPACVRGAELLAAIFSGEPLGPDDAALALRVPT